MMDKPLRLPRKTLTFLTLQGKPWQSVRVNLLPDAARLFTMPLPVRLVARLRPGGNIAQAFQVSMSKTYSARTRKPERARVTVPRLTETQSDTCSILFFRTHPFQQGQYPRVGALYPRKVFQPYRAPWSDDLHESADSIKDKDAACCCQRSQYMPTMVTSLALQALKAAAPAHHRAELAPLRLFAAASGVARQEAASLKRRLGPCEC